MPKISDRELGARLQLARREADKTQDEAAEFLGIARTTLVAIEKGERKVRPEELLRFASYYGQKVSNLVRTRAPAAPLALQLRATLDAIEQPGGVLDKAAWEFQHLSEDYVELERICSSPLARKYPPERTFAGIPAERAAEDIAVSERQRLGFGDGPIHNLREMFEQDVGLRIFFQHLPANVAAMFSYDEVLGACVVVNANHSAPRRRLSMAHEYAHFLTSRHQASVDFQGQYNRLPVHERFAVSFAPAFLMPAAGISRRFHEIKAANEGNFTYADLLSLAHYFGVSLEALTRRLEQLRLISRGTWESVKESGFRPLEARALLNLTEAPSSSDLLPTRYLVLAFQAYQKALITEGQFAHFLRVDRTEARRIVEEVFIDQNDEKLARIATNDIDRPATRVS